MLGADLVFRMPVLGALARKHGGTLACNPDAERLLSDGELVGVWPEGFKGIGKPYADRYKLQRFGRGGFVSAALRTGTPIVPVAIVGAETGTTMRQSRFTWPAPSSWRSRPPRPGGASATCTWPWAPAVRRPGCWSGCGRSVSPRAW